MPEFNITLGQGIIRMKMKHFYMLMRLCERSEHPDKDKVATTELSSHSQRLIYNTPIMH